MHYLKIQGFQVLFSVLLFIQDCNRKQHKMSLPDSTCIHIHKL